MHRRQFLASSLALGVATALNRSAAAEEPSAEAARARALYDAIFQRLLVASPQGATALGLDTGQRAALRSRLDDRSPAARMRVLAPFIEAAPRLAAIDAARLTGRDRSDFETVAWLASISRELEAQPIGTVDSYNYPCPTR